MHAPLIMLMLAGLLLVAALVAGLVQLPGYLVRRAAERERLQRFADADRRSGPR